MPDVRFSLFPLTLLALCLGMAGARAQSFLPFSGFDALPSFAWSQPTLAPGGVKWEGSYARISSGFHVSSSKRLGTSAGPTFGLEAGTMRQEGNFVYGIVGALEFMPAVGGYGTPGFGQAAYTRDFSGAFQVKAGQLHHMPSTLKNRTSLRTFGLAFSSLRQASRSDSVAM